MSNLLASTRTPARKPEALAQAKGVKIDFVRKKDFRKETRIQQILKERGQQPGLVHIIGAMGACSS